MPDDAVETIVHTIARALTDVLWHLGDAISGASEHVYTAGRKVNDAGYAVSTAACDWSEGRSARAAQEASSACTPEAPRCTCGGPLAGGFHSHALDCPANPYRAPINCPTSPQPAPGA